MTQTDPTSPRSPAPGRTGDTCERILDAAERLFASDGIDATSLRHITRTADVNLAAVHYHFGSKDGLLDAVVERRAQPVNAAQATALEKLADAGSPSVAQILHAFLEPVAESHRAHGQGPILAALLSRIQAQPPDVVERLFRRHFGEMCRRFVEGLQHALPHHPHDVVADRFRFAVGVVTHVFSSAFSLDTIPGHPSKSAVEDGGNDLYDELISFLAAGLEAPTSSRPRLRAVEEEESER